MADSQQQQQQPAESAQGGQPAATSAPAQLAIPPTIPLDQLALALVKSSDPPVFESIPESRLVSPDQDLIVHLYSIALQFPTLRQRVISLEQEKVEWIAKDAVITENINSFRQKNIELEQSFEQQSASTLQLNREKEALAADVVSLQNQLGAANTSLENEKREAEASRADRDRLQSELGSAFSQVARLKTEVESERTAKEMVASEKDRLAAELTGLSAQLSTLRSSTESGVRHAAEVRGRLEQIEQEKRELLSSLQREREETTRKSQEIESLLSRLRDARQEISRISTAHQQSQSNENSARFRLQGLEQELELVKKDAEWAHAQLVQANQASASFRSAKKLELSGLEADLDAARQELSSSRSKLTSLQQAYDETTTRLSQNSAKIAELQSRIATQENSFRSEINTQTQLVQLLENRAHHAQQRIDELEDQWQTVLEQCRVREETAWAESRRERELREQLENDNEELSQALDRLANGIGIGVDDVGGAAGGAAEEFEDDHVTDNGDGLDDDAVSEMGSFAGQSRSSTPASRRFTTRRPGNGNGHGTLSNTALYANKVQKSGKTFSQVYVELTKTQEELRRERLESSRLSNVLAQVMEELQDRAPALQAQREETERLTHDLEELLKQVATTSEERDQAKASAQRFQLDAERLERENGLISQQLADFGRQVRELLKEIIIRDDPSASARLEDDGTLLSELDAAAPIPESGNESDTQAVITAQLITFRSLSELCAQNARLIQVTRQLGAKMEEEERNYRARLAEDENAAVSEARDLILRLEDEVRTERFKTEEVSRERDMFRHLCATGGRRIGAAGEGDDAANDATAAGLQAQQATPAAAGSEYESLRNRYETLKAEHDAEVRRFRDEAQSLRTELGNTSISAAREKASREAVEESLATLRRSFELKKTDLEESIKRAQGLHEALTRKDIATHAIEEQLIENRSTAERLRAQVATLAAEKEIWKQSETRLLDENRSITVERNNLQELIRSTQQMQAELEARGNEARERLAQDAKRLAQENEDLKDKLSNEMELYRQLSLRREVESKDLHQRIDSASAELSNAREALAVARTSADQTQLRVEDLTKQLETTRDKLAIYERREQLARDPVGFQAQQSTSSIQLSREEQLAIELADLKAGRAAAQIEVQQARVQVEQSNALVAEKETQLTALKAAYEEHKASTEASLATKNSEVAALQAQVQSLTTDLGAAQTQSQSLQADMEKQRKVYAEDKRSLEDVITQLGSAEERAKSEQENVQGEIRKHIKAAKEAELKFAESEAKLNSLNAELAEVKEQLNKVRQEATTLRSQKDRSEADWGREKAGWETLKLGLEREKTDLKRRIDDLSAQNQILHGHLETVSAQANQIRQAASDPSVSITNEMEVDTQESTAQAPSETATAVAAVEGAQPTELQQATTTEGEGVADAAASSSDAPALLKQEEAQASSAAPAPASIGLPPALAKGRIDELQEVIKYLRKEKEIVDLQMELNKQETARLKLSLDHVNKTLEETRHELSEERSRNAGATANAGQHAELLEKINELNVLRETNNTLREEAERSTKRIGQLEALLTTANGELEPLKEQLRNAQIELEACQAELNVIREDNKRWQTRAQSLLETHGIGEEMKKVEAQRAEVSGKVEEVEKERDEARAETERVRSELQVSKSNFEKLREQVRARIANERKAVAEAQERANAAQKEKEDEVAKFAETISTHEASIAALTAERDNLKQELEAAQSQVKTEPAAEGTTPAAAASAAEPAEQQTAIQQAVEEAQKKWDEVKAQLEAEKAEAEKARDRHLQKGKEFLKNQRAAEAQAKEHEATIAQLKAEFANNHAEAIQTAVNEKLAEQQQQQGESGASPAPADDTKLAELQARITELEQELEEANKQVNRLEIQISAGMAGDAAFEQLRKQHAEELAAKEAEMSSKIAALPKADAEGTDVEEIVQARLKALEDERDAAVKEAVEAARSQMDEQLKARFEAGKNEANLRNQLLVKQRDNRIAKLTAEIAELKGEAAPAATPAAAVPTAPAAQGQTRPGVFGRGGAQGAARGGRGGMPAKPGTVRPPTGPAAQTTAAATAPVATTSIRGAARGGRGGAGAAGAKRKLSAQGTPAAEAKKQKAAGAPVPLKRPTGQQGGQQQPPGS